MVDAAIRVKKLTDLSTLEDKTKITRLIDEATALSKNIDNIGYAETLFIRALSAMKMQKFVGRRVSFQKSLAHNSSLHGIEALKDTRNQSSEEKEDLKTIQYQLEKAQ